MVLIYEFTLENHRKTGVGKIPNQSFLLTQKLFSSYFISTDSFHILLFHV